MKFLRYALAALALLCAPVAANAATCFWVGGTGNYDSVNITSWASGTGGTGGTCAATGGIPKNAADVATFDGSSGGGTITVCGALSTTCPTSSGTISIGQITMGAFTGTLDFSAINPNVNLSVAFSGTGAGTRTLNLGSGTWTLSGAGTPWNISATGGLTFSGGSATLNFTNTTSSNVNFMGGGLIYGTVTINANSNGGPYSITGNNTFSTLNLTAPLTISWPASGTTTITNAFNWSGSSGNYFYFYQGTSASITTVVATGGGTIAWAALFGMHFTTGTVNATNSFDLKANSGVTITAPSAAGGGGSHCIGC